MSKTIDGKVETKKVEEVKKESEGSYGKWLALVVVTILIFGFIGYKYLLNVADELKTKTFESEAKIATIEKKPEEPAPIIESSNFADEIEISESTSESQSADVITEEASPFVKNKEEAASQTQLFQQEDQVQEYEPLVVDNSALEAVISRQENTIIYLAAKALKASEGGEEFQENLEFLDASSKDVPTIQSKLNLLRIATKDGLRTSTDLLASFKVANAEKENAQEKTIWENVKSSIGELVKITKIEGDISTSDDLYERAEIAAKENDYQALAIIAEKLNSKELQREVSNIQRVEQTVDYIFSYAKNKLVQ